MNQQRTAAIAVLVLGLAIAAAGAIIVAISTGTSGEGERKTAVLAEIAVPAVLPVSNQARAISDTGQSVAVAGGTASLVFGDNTLLAVDLPLVLPDGFRLRSFEDPVSGWSLQVAADAHAALTLRLPPHEQGSAGLTIDAAVTDLVPRPGGIRVGLGELRARTDFLSPQTVSSRTTAVTGAQLQFSLRRLPALARLKVTELGDSSTLLQAGASQLGTDSASWRTALTLRVDKSGLVNGTDIEEARLNIRLLAGRRTVEVAAVRFDDAGHAERLEQIIAGDSSTVAFRSPSGFSTFVVLERKQPALATLTPAPGATLAPTPPPATVSPQIPTVATATGPTAPVAGQTPAGPEATPTPPPTQAPSPAPTVPARPTPVPTATLAPVPTSTPPPSPVSTPTAAPTTQPPPTTTGAGPSSGGGGGGGGGGSPPATPAPTPTPTPAGPDNRYGVILHTGDSAAQAWFLGQLGATWFLDFGADVSSVPGGRKKLVNIASLPGPSAAQIQTMAQQAPGAIWYILGEPNRKQGVIDATSVVTQLHDLYTAIKAADPAARITSPSLLNWDFTCRGCGPFSTQPGCTSNPSDGGYLSGHCWTNSFLAAYRAAYGVDPPIDIWAIDVYPIVWLTGSFPTVDSSIPINQIIGLRQYLNTIPAYQNTPIWITELSLHWGWDQQPGGFMRFVGGRPTPCGSYQTAQVTGYFRTVYDWLEANAQAMNIQRWFTFITYLDLASPPATDPVAGASMFDSPGVGAGTTSFGQFFRSRVFHTAEPPAPAPGPTLPCP